MIVFRLIAGARTEHVESAKDVLVLGSSPTADVTFAYAGWPGQVATLEVREDSVQVSGPPGLGSFVMPPRVLRAGDATQIGGVRIEIVGIGAETSPAAPTSGLFGDYDDDPLARPSSSIAGATFDLAPEPARAPEPSAPAPRQTPAPQTPAPQTSAPQTPAPQTPAAAAQPAATRRSQPSPQQQPAAPAATDPANASGGDGSLVTAGFPAPTFGQEFVTQLRRAPFFVISAAIHALLLLLITVLVDTTNPERKSGLGTMTSSLSEDDDFGETEEMVETFDLGNLEQLETEPEPMDFDAPSEDKAESPNPEPDPFQAELDDAQAAMTPPTQVGILPSSMALKAKTARRAQIPVVPPKVLGKEFRGMATAGAANQRAAQVVRDMIGRGRSGRGATLDDIRGEDLLVITGGFDSIEKVLKSLGLPFKTAAPYDLDVPGKVDFSRHKVVFWNCGERIEGGAMRKVKRQLERFVRGGGYLFSTDWGIAYVVEEVFPGFVKSSGRSGPRLPDMVVDIQPSYRRERHPLLEGVFLPGVKGRWWLEEMSFDIEVGPRGKGKVEILIESPMLRDVYGRSPNVAVTFPYGRGRVLHAMGHYFQKAGNVAGTIASHRLAMNFVLQRINQE